MRVNLSGRTTMDRLRVTDLMETGPGKGADLYGFKLNQCLDLPVEDFLKRGMFSLRQNL